MAKKKEAQETAGKKQGTRRKKQADAEKIKEEAKEVKSFFEVCTVFAEGDNIDMVAKQLTGHSRKAFALCEYSGVNLCDVKPGTILKWPVR